MSVEIVETTVASHNTFLCGSWALEAQFSEVNYARRLCLSRHCMITTGHYFDIVGQFVLGERSWIAGHGSQFWTHGVGQSERNISIGSDCYIGSAVRFTPGSAVGSHCIVGIGSVVTKKFDTSYAMIAGVPAKIIKEDYDWELVKSIGEPSDRLE